MASNGYLPQSELRPVAGGGYLQPAAAAAWNALAAKVYLETGVKIAPNGSDSTYRPYARQVYWRNYWCSQGNCGNAAVPGTSNHGWGLAVDTDDHDLVNRYGAPFGWQKAWSDAPSEPWHFRYASGHYSGGDPGPDYSSKPPKPSWWTRVKRKLKDARKKFAHKSKRRKKSDRKGVRARLHDQLTRLRKWIEWAADRLRKNG